MSKRYGVLPSQLLNTADTFDVMVMDVACTYESIKRAEQSNKPLDKSMYSQEDLEYIYKKAKE